MYEPFLTSLNEVPIGKRMLSEVVRLMIFYTIPVATATLSTAETEYT